MFFFIGGEEDFSFVFSILNIIDIVERDILKELGIMVEFLVNFDSKLIIYVSFWKMYVMFVLVKLFSFFMVFFVNFLVLLFIKSMCSFFINFFFVVLFIFE